MQKPSCPPHSELSDFAACALTNAEAERIADHLCACKSCSETVAKIEDATDKLLRPIKPKQIETSFVEEPEFLNTLRALRRITPGTAQSDFTPAAPSPSYVVPPAIGDYEILGKLGEGGMGVLYRALHTRLKREVAIKLLPAEYFDNSQAVARFQREMAIIGRLDHPNIVRATDAGEENNVHYLAMDLIDGENLSVLAGRHGRLRIADACAVIVQAARALQFAHQHGLVHRDIKPSNLMLARSSAQISFDGQPPPEPTVKLLDLGLAVLRDESADDELTSSRQLMGTVDYIAPEQAESSHQVDTRADIYALGATLYRFLAGHAPFSTGEFAGRLSKLTALANQEPRSITEVRSDVPQPLADILHRMLAKRPEDRFATSADVASALSPFAQGAKLSELFENTSETSKPPMADVQAHEPHLKPERHSTRTKPHKKRFPPTLLLLALSLSVVFGIAAIVTYRLSTDQGTLVIEISDPAVEFALKKDGFAVRDTQNDKQWTITAATQQLPAGRYELADPLAVLFISDPDGGHTATREFSLRRGQTLRARVKLLPAGSTPDSSAPAHGDWRPGPPATLPGLIARPSQFSRLKDWQVYLLTPRQPTSAAWSPDGAMIAIGSEDGMVRVYRVENQEFHPQRFFPGHQSLVASLSWDADGQRLVSQARDVRLWNVATGKQEAVVPLDAPASWLVWNWSTNRIVVGSLDGRLHFLSGSGKYLSSIDAHDSALVCLDWSDAGKRLITLDEDGTAIVRTEQGEQLVSIPVGKTARQCRFSPDGKLVAIRFWSFDAAPAIHVYDAQNGKLISTLPNENERGWYEAIDWLSGDVLLATRYDGLLKTWHVTESTEDSPFRSPLWRPNQLISFEIAPGGQLAVAGLLHTGPKLIDLANRRVLSPLPEGPADYTSVALCPNGKRIAAGAHDGKAWILDPDGRLLRIIDSGWGRRDSFAVTFKDAATVALSADGKLDLYNVDDGSLQSPTNLDVGTPIGWSSGGKHLAVRSRDGGLQLWSPDSASHQVVLDKIEWIDARWSPNGDALAISLRDGVVTIYTVADGSARELQIEARGGLAWSSDGIALLALAKSDGLVNAYNVQSGKLLWKGSGGEGPLAVDPARMRYAALGGGILADATDGDQISRFRRLQRGASWTADGSLFVSFDDTSLNVWDGRTLQPLWKAVPVDSEQAIVLSAAGQLLHTPAALAGQHLVYVVKESDGSFRTLRHDALFAPGGNSFDGLPVRSKNSSDP